MGFDIKIEIKNISPEDLTTFFARLGEPAFNEMMDIKRLDGISKLVQEGNSVEEAKSKWEQYVDEQIQGGPEEDGPIPGQVNFSIEQPAPKLHLDGPPPAQKKETTLHDITVLACQIRSLCDGEPKIINEILAEYHVQYIKDIKKEHLPAIYEKLEKAKEALEDRK